MRTITDHHHYNVEKNIINDRVSVYERYIIDMLLNSDVKDIDRESSIAFELMHHHSCAQFARVLARQRNLPVDVCTVGALLHDIYVIKTGKYSNHAHNGVSIAKQILNKLGRFSVEEQGIIISIIENHSDKEVFSECPYAEFGKDVDVLDSFLYPNCYEYYLKHKQVNVFYFYIERAKRIWNELNIPYEKAFFVLDNYVLDNWLDKRIVLSTDVACKYVELFLETYSHFSIPEPTFILTTEGDNTVIYINEKKYNSIINNEESLCLIEKKETCSDDIKDLFSNLKEENDALVIWGALDVYEKHLITDNRIKDFINDRR